MPNIVEDNAIDLVTRHLESQDYEVTNVAKGKRPASEHRGYDLVAQKPGEAPIKIEVKGCTRPWGIPDPYATEFDENRRLVADFLYVIYLLDGEEPKLCVIPRDALNPEDIVPKFGYRIRSHFKKKSVLERVF